MALPRRHEGRVLSFEEGTRHAFGNARSHAGARILVAGCGTLEALVVAEAHPLAREIVALDCSTRSIARLNRRIGLARARNILLGPLGRKYRRFAWCRATSTIPDRSESSITRSPPMSCTTSMNRRAVSRRFLVPS